MKKRNLVFMITALILAIMVFLSACDLFPSSSGTSKYLKPKNNKETEQQEQKNDNGQNQQVVPSTDTDTLNENYPAEEQEDFLHLLHNGYEIETKVSTEYFPDHPRLIALSGYISYLYTKKNDNDRLLLAYFDTADNARNAADDFNDNKYDGWQTTTAFSLGNEMICTYQTDPSSIPALTSQSSFTALEKKIRNDFFALLEFYHDCYLNCYFETSDSALTTVGYYWLHCSKEEIQDQNKDFNIDILYFLNSVDATSYYDFMTANVSPEPEFEFIRKGNTFYCIDRDENAKVLLGIA